MPHGLNRYRQRRFIPYHPRPGAALRVRAGPPPCQGRIQSTVEWYMDNTASVEQAKANLTLTHVIYGLYAASFFVGITGLVAIILNYVKRGDVAGSFLASHFRWQMRTFWFGLLWTLIGVVTFYLVIGWLIMLANLIWIIYRLVKGWLRLTEGKAMYV
jgi:uncharacterized membrane protein